MNCIFEPIWFHLKALKKIVLGEKKVEEKNFKKKYKFFIIPSIFSAVPQKHFQFSLLQFLGCLLLIF